MFGLFRENISKKEVQQITDQAKFNGRIHPIDSLEKVNNALKFLFSEKVLGFDCEAKPTFGKGPKHKVALIQLSTEKDAYLFRTNKIGIPFELAKLLASPKIKKIGLYLPDDFERIKRLEDFPLNGFIDILDLVSKFGIEARSLRKIYAILFNERIAKTQQCSNWVREELSLAQMRYAALDAYACLRIYHYLQGIKMKPTLFFSQDCPDTAPFVAQLDRLNVAYQAVDILENLANFKQFLKLRDQHSAFDNAKANGYIGIPALVLEDERVVLELEKLETILG